MKRIPVILLSLPVICIFIQCSKKAADLDIPDKRAFPVNNNVSPCKDFARYACSKVESNFKMPDDRARHVFSFSDSYERILRAKKKYLESIRNQTGLSERGETLKTIYSACMNVSARKKEERKIVRGIIKQVQEIKDRQSFLKFVASHTGTADQSFIEHFVIPNLDDPEWNDIVFISGLQSLPERSYYDKKEVIADLQKLIGELFKTVKLDKPNERAEHVVEFEKKFTRTFPLPQEIKQVMNRRTGITRNRLIGNYGNFHLRDFLKKIPRRTHIRHITPKNFKFLQKAMSSQPLETLKSVYLWHALLDYMNEAYPEFFKKRFKFWHKHLGGPKVRSERKERCTRLIMRRFSKEIDAELLPVLFPSFPEQEFIKLVERVRSAIIAGMKKNNWLSKSARKSAIKKIKTARLRLVKPQNDREWDFNPPAKYSTTTHYANMQLLDENLIKKELKELKHHRIRSRWLMGPLTVNAYYQRADNTFVMPIGILQFPFYDPALSDEANFGAVGAVVGHELGHGIDDNGSKYDFRGQMISWMSDAERKEFKERGKKLIEQFNRIGHNGKLTLDENIADLVGITFAYRAAFPTGKGSRKAKKAFFLQNARLWCSVMRPKMKARLLKTDSHSLGFARINEQMKHQHGFQEAFQCKLGDAMYLNKKERVRIW